MTGAPAAGTKVRVVYRKWDGSLHWNGPARVLGSDEHGTWLGVARGTMFRRGDAPPQELAPSVFLVPEGAWWFASFPLQPRRYSLYVDIATPPEWHGDELHLIDLDLDVLRTLDGEAILVDEDEFEEHRQTMSYPEHFVDRARTEAARLVLAVGSGEEPFGSAAGPWQERSAELDAT